MKKIITSAALLLAISFSACNKKNAAEQTPQTDSSSASPNAAQNNALTIAEIAVHDFPRAVKFYQTVMDIRIEEFNMEGVQMGSFPATPGTVNVVLAKGEDYTPSADGTTIYLNAGEDLQPELDKVESNGGKILVGKTMIAPEMGFFALFLDSEGNKIGLHSIR